MAGSGQPTRRRCLQPMGTSSMTGQALGELGDLSLTTGSRCSREGRRRLAWPYSTTSMEMASSGMMWRVIMRSLLFVKMSQGTYSLYSANKQLEGIQDGHFYLFAFKTVLGIIHMFY